MAESNARTYTVKGMTCGHCRLSVMEEVGELDGVDRVEVELETARLEVAGSGFTDDQVRAAVEEAGYELAVGR